jgi:hypothetical protein
VDYTNEFNLIDRGRRVGAIGCPSRGDRVWVAGLKDHRLNQFLDPDSLNDSLDRKVALEMSCPSRVIQSLRNR